MILVKRGEAISYKPVPVPSDGGMSGGATLEIHHLGKTYQVIGDGSMEVEETRNERTGELLDTVWTGGGVMVMDMETGEIDVLSVED